MRNQPAIAKARCCERRRLLASLPTLSVWPARKSVTRPSASCFETASAILAKLASSLGRSEGSICAEPVAKFTSS